MIKSPISLHSKETSPRTRSLTSISSSSGTRKRTTGLRPSAFSPARSSCVRFRQRPRYLGRCRNLTQEERAGLKAEGRKPVVRFRVPEDEEILVSDLVRGDVSFECSEIGDFIMIKSDGIPTYNFAVVVDDHTMAISHVIRAEEHLSNTPRQILLYNALSWETPKFAHVSLILGKDRSKMSKRHGATAIEQYQ